ncbi:MAG: ABC transporter permease [Oscillospiraceae bacterium]|jgi:ABC-type transport system involved in multi-copper enzyme maturation permease subunit|nr:ABC transporter permease [Oscillospiraceae bacterium]
MFNLIKSDFYKLWNDRKFWVFSLLTVAFTALSVILNRISGISTDASGKVTLVYQTSSRELLLNSLFVNVFLFASIFATIFSIDEFNCGLLSMNVARGVKRAQIYFSKLVASVCNLFILIILNILTNLICVKIVVKEFLLPDNFWLGLGFQVFVYLCCICVITAIAFFIKSKVWTIAIAILSNGLDLIIMAFSFYIEEIFKLTDIHLENYWILHYSYARVFDFTEFNQELKNYIILGLAVSVCYAVAATVLSILKLKQRDLK